MQAIEAKTESTQERYQAFIRNSSEGIWRFELDEPISIKLSVNEQVKRVFKYAYLAEANDAMARMYGFETADEIAGTRLSQIMLESDPDNNAFLTAFIQSGYHISDVESHEIDKNGNDKYFRNSLIGFREGNYMVRAWGTQQDITGRRTAEEALKRSQDRLQLALQASSMGLWEWDIQRNELYWSDELKMLFGLSPSAEVDYDKYMGFMHPDDRDRAQHTIQHSMKTGGMYQFEHRIIWSDGSEHWILGRGQAYLQDGKAVRMIGTSTSIDEQKRAQAVASRQNSYLEMLHATAVETSRHIGQQQKLLESILRQAGSICGTEHGFIYLKGERPDELVVRLATGTFKSDIGLVTTKGVGLSGKVWDSGKPIILTDYDSWEGRKIDYPAATFKAIVGIPLFTPNEVTGVLAVAHTVSGATFDNEQVDALLRLGDLASIAVGNARLFEELQESEQRFRSMADMAPVLIWLTDVSGRGFYFNKPWLEFTGRTMAQEAGNGWIEGVHPDDSVRCLQAYSAAMESHKPFTVEYRLRRHDGVYRWILDKGIPRVSPTGEFQGYIGSGIDIDDMKRSNELVLANARLRSQQAQLLTLNKTKDEFIALASHQLRTPATAVKQYTSLLIHEFAGPLTEEQLRYLQVAYDSNERQLQIISDLLKTAQIDSSRYVLEKKSQNIAKIIRTAAAEVAPTCALKSQNIAMEHIANINLEVDANEIKLALINLLENASKYSFDGTTIKLSMHTTVKRVEIAVTDQGVGIARADIKRIFDKFTRVDNELSDTVTGTGFGLYWVKRIIGLHGGSIRVEAEVGKGSTFTVRLPR